MFKVYLKIRYFDDPSRLLNNHLVRTTDRCKKKKEKKKDRKKETHNCRRIFSSILGTVKYYSWSF